MKFKITIDDQCSLCSNQDSVIHTFAECPETNSIFNAILNWFNNINNLSVTPSVEQIQFHIAEAKSRLTDAQERRLDLLFQLKLQKYLLMVQVASVRKQAHSESLFHSNVYSVQKLSKVAFLSCFKAPRGYLSGSDDIILFKHVNLLIKRHITISYIFETQ